MPLLYLIAVFILASLPAIVWFLFFLQEDVHPEPRTLLIYTFAVGGLMSVPVLFFQVFFRTIFPYGVGGSAGFLLGFALIEELFKFLAAYWSVHRERAFDEPVDAMVYMIAAASGFATVENLLVIADSIRGLSFASFRDAASVLLLRFVGATLLHLLASAVVGYYWARGKIGKERSPSSFLLPYILWGVAIAAVLHAFFNYLVLEFQDFTLLFSSILLVFISFFVLVDFDKLRRGT